jgi:hypothetical protein
MKAAWADAIVAEKSCHNREQDPSQVVDEVSESIVDNVVDNTFSENSVNTDVDIFLASCMMLAAFTT